MFWWSIVFGILVFVSMSRLREYLIRKRLKSGKSVRLKDSDFSISLLVVFLFLAISIFQTVTSSKPPESLDACLDDPECTVETRVMNCIDIGLWESPFQGRRCVEASEEKYETIVSPDLDAGADSGTELDLDAGFDSGCM